MRWRLVSTTVFALLAATAGVLTFSSGPADGYADHNAFDATIDAECDSGEIHVLASNHTDEDATIVVRIDGTASDPLEVPAQSSIRFSFPFPTEAEYTIEALDPDGTVIASTEVDDTCIPGALPQTGLSSLAIDATIIAIALGAAGASCLALHASVSGSAPSRRC